MAAGQRAFRFNVASGVCSVGEALHFGIVLLPLLDNLLALILQRGDGGLGLATPLLSNRLVISRSHLPRW
jgi:hypothetical protein